MSDLILDLYSNGDLYMMAAKIFAWMIMLLFLAVILDAGWQFAERMAVDFHRSMELDELDQELFSQEEKTGLYVLAKDPGFLKRYYLGKVVYSKKIFDLNNELGRRAEELDASHRENDELRREMEAQRINYETSTTFRVGKAVMFVPVTLKKAVKKLLHRN